MRCLGGIVDVAAIYQYGSPVKLADFLNTCTKPWLHYGYCQHCMAVAKSSNTDITQHIIHCEALFGNCLEGRHEYHSITFTAMNSVKIS